MTFPWILIAVLIPLVILGILVIVLTKKKKTREPDYYAFFWIGLVWVIFGAIMLFLYKESFNPLFYLGLVFFLVGLLNKKKWKRNRRTWKNMDKEEKKIMKIVMIILFVLVIVGLFFFFLAENIIIK